MFLQSEVQTGLTFARIALKARDRKKISRNAQNARTAYNSFMEHLSDLPANTPGLERLQKQAESLQDLLLQLDRNVD